MADALMVVRIYVVATSIAQAELKACSEIAPSPEEQKQVVKELDKVPMQDGDEMRLVCAKYAPIPTHDPLLERVPCYLQVI